MAVKQPLQPLSTDPKDWLLNQGPKFKDGLPLRARVKRGKLSDLPIELPASAYRGIAAGLSSSDIEVEPDRFCWRKVSCSFPFRGKVGVGARTMLAVSLRLPSPLPSPKGRGSNTKPIYGPIITGESSS